MNISKLKLAAVIGGSLLLATFNANAGIEGSKHDFTTNGGAQSTAGTEICVFCHTPHGGQTNTAPLWNKPATTAGFIPYASSTLDAAGSLGSVSLACLSCHDGVQAMDAVLNAPGSGGYVALGTNLLGGVVMTGDPSAPIAGAPGVGENRIPNLGKDLRNDHPVSIAYAGGGCGVANLTDTAVKCTPTDYVDKDFKSVLGANLGGIPVWYVDRNGSAGRQKDDIILYTRTDIPNNENVEPTVECASCHDPHAADSFNNTTEPSPSFMRFRNTGSAVCLACHDK